MSAGDRARQSEVARSMQRVAIAVQDALDEPWTLASMAATAGYAEHYFAHAFARALGQPPLRYLRGLRLERAAHELAFSPEKSLAQVASEAGYGSYEAFRRVFVREFGVPPGEMRSSVWDLRGRRPRASPAPGERRPDTCEGGPWIESLGPRRGLALKAEKFTDEAIAQAWRRFGAALPAGVGRQLGAAVSPWGWLARSSRPRVYRCLALDLAPGQAQGLERWSMQASWHARFDYAGPTGGMHELFGWIFARWLPASSLRCTFAPILTLFDEQAWLASGYQRSRARVYIPVRKARILG